MTAPRPPDDSLRDPVLDAAWKTHSTELPPAHVDAAILAAAHREAGTRPRPLDEDDGSTHARRPARTWWGLAAAATIGAIAFGIVQLAPPLHKPDPMVASDVPSSAGSASTALPRDERAAAQMAETPTASPAVPAAPTAPGERVAMSRTDESPAPTTQAPGVDMSQQRKVAKVARAERGTQAGEARTQADAAVGASARDQERQRADDARASQDRSEPAQGARPSSEPRVAAIAPSPPASIPSPRPFPATPAPGIAESNRAEAPGDAAKPETSNAFAPRRGAPSERAAAMMAPQADAAASPQRQREADPQPLAKARALTPQAWIERIAMLHEQQRLDDAARALNAFRDAYPDADRQLPASLAPWAAGVKRTAR